MLDLGEHALTGVFPGSPDEPVSRGPLCLVWCRTCTLLQLAHSYDPAEMYGDNYGYRSGLNRSMVGPPRAEGAKSRSTRPALPGDVVLDIGSNDGTLLGSYATNGLRKIGIDPTAARFADFYPPDTEIVADFFSAARFEEAADQPAHVITSVAMFYDLEDPVAFASRRSGLPRRRRRLALRAVVHAVDASLDGLRHRLPRAPRVLLPRYGPRILDEAE